MVLARDGYRVIEAENGKIAWELFQKEPVVHAVVTDIMMPHMNGLELAEKLHKDSPDLPIIVMTALGDKETIKSALRLGVSEFLEKPVHGEKILRCISQVIQGAPDADERVRMKEATAAVRRVHNVMIAGNCAGFPIHTLIEPIHDAGGDTFRCVKRQDGSCVFLLVDVMGHSIDSSYAVASFLGTFSAHSDFRGTCRELLVTLDREIRKGPFSSTPVCAMVGFWRVETGRLEVANAGLPHGRIFRRHDATVERMALDGTPMGLVTDPAFDERVYYLKEGDRVLLGSDGFFEARSSDGEFFETRPEEEWRRMSDGSLSDSLKGIRSAADEWTGGNPEDDLMIVALDQQKKTAGPDCFSVDLASTFDDVDTGCDLLRKFVEELPGGESVNMFNMSLTVREALLNGVIHGNKQNPKRSLGFCGWVEKETNRLFVSVLDYGKGFDLEEYKEPDDELREGKRGVPLMRELSDGLFVAPGETKLAFQLSGGLEK